MPLSHDRQLAAITHHATLMAEAAGPHLDALIESCPGWSVLSVVQHVVDVHWFWATVVEQKLTTRPNQDRPAPPAADAALDALRAGADRLVKALAATDPSTPMWTWAPHQQDAAFIARHQVQEIAVHHWDVANAAYAPVLIESDIAVDAVDEFLHFSVSSAEDPQDPARPALGGTFTLHATDTDDAWTVTGGAAPGTVLVTSGADPAVPGLRAPARDLLLWCYRRIELDRGGVPDDVIARFVALTETG